MKTIDIEPIGLKDLEAAKAILLESGIKIKVDKETLIIENEEAFNDLMSANSELRDLLTDMHEQLYS